MSSAKINLDTDLCSTIYKDGKPMQTRNGLQLSKQKYRGDWFVNQLAVFVSSKGGSHQRRIKFKPLYQSPRRTKKSHVQDYTASSKVRGSQSHLEAWSPLDIMPKASTAELVLHEASNNDGLINSWAGRTLEDAGTHYYLDTIPRSLPDWAINGLPSGFSAADKTALFSYLDIMPKRTYVFEYFGTMTHNPLRNPAIYQDLVLNSRLLRGAVIIGGVCQAIRCRNADPAITAYLSAELCSWVSPVLSEIFIDTCYYTVVIQAVATLALFCHLCGDYAQWHIHVKGLNKLVEHLGGLGAIPPSSRGIIYKANIIPATELAIEPYIRVRRFYPRILDLVDTETRVETYLAIKQILGSCCGDNATLEFVSSAALFLKAVFPPWTTLKAVDPDALMEEWWSLAYSALTLAGPIWPRQNTKNKLLPDLVLEYASSKVEVTRGRSYRDIIESTLRLSLVLFTKLITPYLVDTPDAHPLLLLLHKQYIRAIVLESQIDEESDLVTSDPSAHTARKSSRTRHAMMRAMRPPLIWCALLGSIFIELSRGRWSELLQGRSFYQDLVVHIVGPNPTDVDDLPESDFEFCHRFDLRIALGPRLDPRAALKSILNNDDILKVDI